MDLDQQISLLSGDGMWHTQALPGLPGVMLSDGPHGLRAQDREGEHLGLNDSAPATCFPTAVTLASSWDEDLVREVGAAVGREARAAGVAVVLGPGMNIKRHPRCGRNFEYFSEDPLVTGRLAAAMVQGIQSQGVGACLKHFAVNNQESHRFVVDAVVDDRTLREIYLAGFEYAVKESTPWTVMAAYNLVNGTYATDNHWLLTQVLRNEWGFDGLVMSDWGATNDRVAGVLAGMDLEMPGSAGAFDPQIRSALGQGTVSVEDIARCAQRVVALARRSPQEPDPDVDFAGHDALARRAAARSSVLLTNDGLLPLQPGQSVALIGSFAEQPRFQGAGSSLVNAMTVTTARDAFAERGVPVTYAPGYTPDGSAPDPRWKAEAVDLARRADVVVLMVGLPGLFESEGYDRDHLHLPGDQEDLIAAVCAANPRTVVALSNGSPIVMPWVDEPAAILESYLGGQASGAALVDVLYGDEEPAGRLAETFPMRAADVSSDPFFPGSAHQVEYREGIYIGYRYATTVGVKPLFPFGHGLGYSTFLIEDCAGDAMIEAGADVALSMTVTNTGPREGSTVVQVYRHDRTGRVSRPRRELAAFKKVTLGAGESVRLEVMVPARAFAFWRDGWHIPEGNHDLEVGFSSEDIVDTVTVAVHGGFDADMPAEPVIAASDEQFAARLGRPVPTPRPLKPYVRNTTVGELSGNPVGKVLREVSLRVTDSRNADPVTRRLIERSIDEGPLRALALLSQGRISLGQVDALVDLANRRPDRVARSFFGWATRLIAEYRR
jgi:beta-glucosidase